MSVKLSRYVFRRVRGRLVAFRKGASSDPNKAIKKVVDQAKKDGVDIMAYASRSRKKLHLSHISVEKKLRKKGLGSKYMFKLSKIADSYGLKSTLQTATKNDSFGTTSGARLKKFYKRFGFVENKGRNKDFSLDGNMYRKPVKFSKQKSMSAIRKYQGRHNKLADKRIADFTDGSIVKKKLYHGTNESFSKFSHDHIGKNVGTASGRGFYFTPHKAEASGYGDKIKEVYLNIKKPIIGSLNTGFKRELKDSEIRKIIKAQGSKQDTWSNWMYKYPPKVSDAKKEFFNSLKKYSKDDVDIINSPIADLSVDPKTNFKRIREAIGIDGVVTSNKQTTHYIALNSDQIMKAPKRSQAYKNLMKKYGKRRKK